MNKRLEILNTIITDLPRISTANGYNNDMAQGVTMVQQKLSALAQLPQVSVIGGEESRDRIENNAQSSFKVYIFSYIKTSLDVAKSGLMTTEAEKWIEDYDNFFRLPGDGGAEKAKVSSLYTISDIESYYISDVNPYYDFADNNRQCLAIQLTVNFIN